MLQLWTSSIVYSNNSYHWNGVNEDKTHLFWTEYTHTQSHTRTTLARVSCSLSIRSPFSSLVLSCGTLLYCKVGQICAPIIQTIILLFRGCMKSTSTSTSTALAMKKKNHNKQQQQQQIHIILRGNYLSVG